MSAPVALTGSVPLETLVSARTFRDVLHARGTHTPLATAFRFTDGAGLERGTLTYAELVEQSGVLARRLNECTNRGDRVLILLPPGLAYVTAIFACLEAEVVAVPAYPARGRRDDERVTRIHTDCDAAVALIPSDAGSADIQSSIVLRPLTRRTTSLTHTPPVDLALIQYTSGSTGEPRGVMLTHAQLLANARIIQEAVPHQTGERAVFWLPPYHDMGLMGGVLQPVYTGVETILMAPATFLQRPMTWLEAMSRYGAVSTAAPDFAYRQCVERSTPAERSALDLSAWRIAFNGAEPLRAETMTAFTSAFAEAGIGSTVFVPCYGLAESTLFVSGGPVSVPPVTRAVDAQRFADGRLVRSDRTDAQIVAGSGGIPAASDVRIVHPGQRVPCTAGDIGEIWVRAENVGAGYWNHDEATAHTFRAQLADGTGPFLRTGDLGAILDGQLFVTGRIKDLLIIGGRNVYPQDIERAIDGAHAAIRPDACVAFQCDDGRTVVLAEVTRHTAAPEIDAVVGAMRKAVADACGVAPEVIGCVRTHGLPRTSSGKLRRRAACEAWVSGALPVLAGSHSVRTSRASHDRRDPLSWITAWVAADRKLLASAVDTTRSLFDAGLDSMGLIRLQAAIETEFQCRLDDRLIFEVPSIAALATIIGNNTTGLATRVTTAASVGSFASSEQAPAAHPGSATRRFADWPEIRALAERRHALGDVGLADPFLPLIEPRDGATVRNARGQLLLNFAGYDYLGMAADARVRDAAAQAIARFGTSSSASRVVSGERSVHRALEAALARFCGTEDAITLVGGHATNVSVLSHLAGSGDLICCDERVHNSLWVGARQSGAHVMVFRHNDAVELDRLLAVQRAAHRRAWVVVESVYSADGDVPDLRAFVAVAHRHEALLFVDEAHGHGVLGATGRGIAEAQGVDPSQVDVWMGTLSKAFASAGGFIAAPRVLIDYLRYTLPGFVFSVGMPPASAAAALCALELLEAEPQRVATLRARALQFRQQLIQWCTELGVAGGTVGDMVAAYETPIIPIITGSAERAVALAAQLESRGVLAAPMLPPAVPEGAARVRFFVTASHTEAQIDAAVRVLAEVVSSPNLP